MIDNSVDRYAVVNMDSYDVVRYNKTSDIMKVYGRFAKLPFVSRIDNVNYVIVDTKCMSYTVRQLRQIERVGNHKYAVRNSDGLIVFLANTIRELARNIGIDRDMSLYEVEYWYKNTNLVVIDLSGRSDKYIATKDNKVVGPARPSELARLLNTNYITLLSRLPGYLKEGESIKGWHITTPRRRRMYSKDKMFNLSYHYKRGISLHIYDVIEVTVIPYLTCLALSLIVMGVMHTATLPMDNGFLKWVLLILEWGFIVIMISGMGSMVYTPVRDATIITYRFRVCGARYYAMYLVGVNILMLLAITALGWLGPVTTGVYRDVAIYAFLTLAIF